MCKAPDARQLIEQLKNDYERGHYENLQQSLGLISQDHISRGLVNSTTHATARWAAHDGYVRELIEHLLNSLEDKGKTIHRSGLRRTMLSLVESEYNRVKGDVLQTLINAGQHDPNIMRQYESKVDRSIQEAKAEIDRRLSPHEALKNRTNVITSEGAETQDSTTLVDRYKRKAMNNPVLAILVVASAGVVFLAAVFADITTIKNSVWPSPITGVESQPPQPGTAKDATDPNSILQDGSVVGRAVGRVERKDSKVLFQRLVETPELDEQSPFVYRDTTYRIITIGKRSVIEISDIYGMNKDVKSDVVCEVLQ